MRIPPGVIVIVAGLALLAAGLWAACGWPMAAIVVGALLAVIGVLAALSGERTEQP